MKSKAIQALGLVLALLLSGCGAKTDGSAEVNPSGSAVQTAAATQNVTTAAEADTSGMFTDRDLSAAYDESESARIQLNGDAASCDSDAVKIDGGTVTITDEGTYILTGTLDDGMIVVNAGETDKTQLVLDNVSIGSATGAPIYILEADKVVITLAEGSVNTLTNGGAFTAIDDNNIDGVIFSQADLSFNGSGSLSIVSLAGHGIVCKDDLVFAGGTYRINAAAHGIDANDSVRTTGADFTIVSGKDGVHAENADDASLGFVYVADGSFHIEAEGDGISAGGYMQIDDGSFNLISGGGSANAAQQTSDAWGQFGGRGGMGGGGKAGKSQGGQAPGFSANGSPNAAATSETEDTSASIKGLKASGNLMINGGTFTVDAADDALHSNASITVNGGAFELKSGDDGFHADETLDVTAGTIHIIESYEGLEGLHVNVSGGEIDLTASDDGLNAAGGTDQSGFGGQRGNEQFGGGFGGGMSSSSGGSITVSGGSLSIHASGDGLDANGTLEITGGTVLVSCPTSGDTAVLDYDASGVITGGTFIGMGAVQMAQTFSASEQGVIAVHTGNQPAGTVITLRDSDGNAVLSHETDQSFAIVILSSPDIVKGESYTLTIGADSDSVTAD